MELIATITLFQPITLFLKSADDLFGPITTICGPDKEKKKIPWRAFLLDEADWLCVKDVIDILEVGFLVLISKPKSNQNCLNRMPTSSSSAFRARKSPAFGA